MQQLPNTKPKAGIPMHKLRELRLERALTQGELATAAGLNTASISLLETGQRTARPGTVRKIAAALGVPVMTLTKCGPPETEAA